MRPQQLSFLISMSTLALARPNPQTSIPSITDLPLCPQTGALQAIASTGCAALNVACYCASTPFVTALLQYIEANCSAADQATAINFGTETCNAAGIPLTFPSISGSVTTAVSTTAGVGTASTVTTGATSTAASESFTTGSTTDGSSLTTEMSSMITSVSSTYSTQWVTGGITTAANGTWTVPTSTHAPSASMSASTGPSVYTGAAGEAVSRFSTILAFIAAIAITFAFY